MFTAKVFTIAKTWKQPKFILMDEWIQSSQCIYTLEYCPEIKNNEIMPSSTMWVGLEGIMLRNKSDRERQIPYDITYMWNLKYDTK